MKDRGLTVAGASGAPFDQFSMDSRDGEFRGLADWTTVRCYPDYDTPPDVTLMRIPDHSFSPSFADAPDRRFTALPRPDARVVENRFADDWLVYGARDGWWSYPPEADAPPGSAELFAVSLRDPDEIWALPVRHEISRIERLGDGIILTGYRDAAGLSVSLVHLGRSPRVISSTRLDGRFESEGRSHAFNGSVGENGEAVMGLPTTPSEDDSGRYYWRSDYSDVSFLARTAGGRLAPLGELNVTLPAIGEDGWPMEDPDNECEVSCTDWYGNTRPIFIDGRIFGLMGLELVEGVVEDGSIREIGRLDFSAPPPAAAAPLS